MAKSSTSYRRGNPGQFKKGQSGNPGGLTKKQAAARDLVREILADAGPHAARRLVELCDSENEKIALAASVDIVSRIYGKDKEAGDGASERVVSIKILDKNGEAVKTASVGEAEDGEFSQPDAG